MDPPAAMATNVPSSLVNWLLSFGNDESLLIHLSTDQGSLLQCCSNYFICGTFYTDEVRNEFLLSCTNSLRGGEILLQRRGRDIAGEHVWKI